ncbi:MAG TPA: holo-ACP synthase [Chloroflexota bacterium]|nr:holo-ACP synthase [Chloroflexota bacterium]
MQAATGVDLIEIDRIAHTVERFGQRFLDRVYTEREQRYCRHRTERLAGRFAAKEAVSKALGIGIRRLRWRDIEILPNAEGKPEVILHGSAEQAATQRHITGLSVSITHSRDLAAAVVMGWEAR